MRISDWSSDVCSPASNLEMTRVNNLANFQESTAKSMRASVAELSVFSVSAIAPPANGQEKQLQSATCIAPKAPPSSSITRCKRGGAARQRGVASYERKGGGKGKGV